MFFDFRRKVILNESLKLDHEALIITEEDHTATKVFLDEFFNIGRSTTLLAKVCLERLDFLNEYAWRIELYELLE